MPLNSLESSWLYVQEMHLASSVLGKVFNQSKLVWGFESHDMTSVVMNR